jgi:aerobic carbon-monoxide dehydrogenase medium subunit
MKPAAFKYTAPATLDEVFDALASGGDDSRVIAGGQSLVPLLAFRLSRPSLLVDLNRVEGLAGIELRGETLTIGAMTRHRQVEQYPGLRERCTMIVEAVEEIGHAAIRNRGTVGGSLAHADPAAEWPAVALALDAEVDVAGPHGERTIPIAELFFTVFTTTLAAGEVLTRIRFDLPHLGSGSAFVEFARRQGDFAIAGVGALVTLDENGRVADARVALIGVDDRARRAPSVEAGLQGETPTRGVLEAAAAAVNADIDPLSDIQASESYRRHIAPVLTRRALSTAVERAWGGDHRRVA